MAGFKAFFLACSCMLLITNTKLLLQCTTDNARRVILGAMSEWERSVPCIKFQVKSDIDIDFVHFFKGHG